MTTAESQITDISVQDELKTSFLSYSMSVIVSRALPDVRDGLKPVHRRILFGMSQLNLRPERAHVKCARVVGEVMGKYHPHGDVAIYEALVRLALPWAQRIPLVDGHGNFGTQVDGPAAARYTEARMAKAALAMTDELDEDTVDFGANYDGSFEEPKVLPAAFPNLLVNGATGIAVGMATNLAPHNLGEVVGACKHFLLHPEATVEDLMAFIPGPDLPTGGTLLNLEGVAEAYRTGRGMFVMRAKTHFADVTARKKGIIVTELPYQVGAEHVIAAIVKQRAQGRLQGVSNVVDLTDRKSGLRLVIECKTGFQTQAVLDELLRLTPLQSNFHIHNLALVNGQPRTLTLRELVMYYVEHRVSVTTRRCEFRRRKAQARAHLLEGFLRALESIDKVVAAIRSSKDTATARDKLIKSFKLSEIQASAILEMPLRRLTNLEVEKIKTELAELNITIAELNRLLGSTEAMQTLICSELDEVVRQHGSPRRSQLSSATPTIAAVNDAAAKIPEQDVTLTVSATGLIAHWAGPFTGARTKHDAVIAAVATNTHGTVGALTSTGRIVFIPVMETPLGQGKERGSALSEFVQLGAGERLVALVNLAAGGAPLAMGTRNGVVKVLNPADLPKKTDQEVIGLKDGDEVVGAGTLPGADAELVFITSDCQLLRTPASGVRAQGRTGAGVAGVKLAAGAQVLTFAVVTAAATETPVVTVSGGATWTSAKTSPLSQFPAKGRGTAGVRAHRLLRGEERLVAAGVGGLLTGVADNGALVPLPSEVGKRDGAGVKTPVALVAVAVRR